MKIVGLLVFAGLAMMTGSLFERVLSALVQEHLDIDPYIPDSPIWGLSVIVLGLGFYFCARLFDQKIVQVSQSSAGRKDVDKATAQQLLSKCSDDQFREFFYFLTSDHAYSREQVDPIDNFAWYLESSDCRYTDKKVEKSRVRLSRNLSALRSFTAHQFFMTHSGHYSMQPLHNIDRSPDPKKADYALYDELTKQLNQLSETAESSLEDFKKCLRARLQHQV